MRRSFMISLSVGAALLLVSLGLLIAQAPPAIASSGTVTHTTYNDFGNSGPNCVVGSNPTLTNTHISDVGGGAVALAGTLDDDFPGSSLNMSLWETGTWGANPYTPTISNSILTLPATTTTDINGGSVRSITTYTPTATSTIVLESIAAFGSGKSQHIGFGTSDFINKHILFSTYIGDGNLYARVDNSVGPTIQNLGAIPSGMHRYRIEWSQTTVQTDTVTFYIDNVNQIAIAVAHASGFHTYLSNDGPADLNVDVADVAPAYATSGTYTSCALDAGLDNAWQTIGWDAFNPTSGTLTVSARTSFDALNWSSWTTMPVSGTAPGPAYRYAQYQLQLATTDSLTTPVVSAVNLAFDTGARTLSVSDGNTSQATIGNVIPYTLTVTVPQTSTSGLIITDTLPAGMIYNGNQAVTGITTAPTFSESNPNDGSAPVTLTWNFGAGEAVFASSPATITLSARVANVVSNQASTVLTNTASMTYSSPGTTTPATDSVTIIVPQLVVTKTMTPAQAVNGTVVTTTLTVQNTGASTAFDATLDDPMPNSKFVTYTAISTAPGFSLSFQDSGLTTTVHYSGGSIAVSQIVTFSFKATVTSNYTPGETFTNTATAQATTLSGADPNERTVQAGGSDVIAFGLVPDIGVSKTDGRASAAPGDTLVYTLTISNVGLVAAPNVRITDTLPANVAFVSASNGGSNAGGVVTWPVVTTLTIGSSLTRTVTLQVNNPIAAGVTQLVNTAQATHDGTNGPEPTPLDNTATDTDTVNAAPDLAISKSDGGITAIAGSLISYTLTYTTTGNQGASGVVITETVPANTTFVAGSSSPGWSCANGATAGTVCTLSVGTLAGGATGSKVFAVRVVIPFPNGVNTISNTATISDDGSNGADPPGNNSGSDTTGVINYNIFLPLIMKGS